MTSESHNILPWWHSKAKRSSLITGARQLEVCDERDDDDDCVSTKYVYRYELEERYTAGIYTRIKQVSGGKILFEKTFESHSFDSETIRRDREYSDIEQLFYETSDMGRICDDAFSDQLLRVSKSGQTFQHEDFLPISSRRN